MKTLVVFGYYGAYFLWNLYNHKSSRNNKKDNKNLGEILIDEKTKVNPKTLETKFKV
jgi:hypothetical protein